MHTVRALHAQEVPTDLTLRSVDAQQIAEAVTTDVQLASDTVKVL